jgi:NTP pyrophosphatase (non-canonical NTP hydrolase)
MDLERLSDDVEVVSRGYASAHGFKRDDTWFLLKLQEEVGELTQAFLMRAGQARSKGNTPRELDDKFGAELADVLCHVLLMARHHGVDLEEQVQRKWLVWHPGTSASAVSEAVGQAAPRRDLGAAVSESSVEISGPHSQSVPTPT